VHGDEAVAQLEALLSRAWPASRRRPWLRDAVADAGRRAFRILASRRRLEAAAAHALRLADADLLVELVVASRRRANGRLEEQALALLSRPSSSSSASSSASASASSSASSPSSYTSASDDSCDSDDASSCSSCDDRPLQRLEQPPSAALMAPLSTLRISSFFLFADPFFPGSSSRYHTT